MDESPRAAVRCERTATIHPQVRITWAATDAEVDEDIADLILACWRNGIHTTMSCQDSTDRPGEGPRRVWVEFPAPDAERFLSIVADRYDNDGESEYNRTVGDWTDEDWESYQRERAWRFDASVSDLSAPTEGPDEGQRRTRHVSVRFPITDLEEVVRRLTDAYQGRSPPSPGA